MRDSPTGCLAMEREVEYFKRGCSLSRTRQLAGAMAFCNTKPTKIRSQLQMKNTLQHQFIHHSSSKTPPENYDNQLQFPEFVCPVVQITVDPDMIWKKTRWAIKISTQRVLKDISTEFCLQTTTWLSVQRKMITGDSSCEEWLTTLTRSDSQSSNSKAKKWVSEPLMFDDILSFREKFWSQSISLCLCVAFCAFITFIAYSYKECVAFGSSVPRWCCSACLCLVLKSKRRNWSW